MKVDFLTNLFILVLTLAFSGILVRLTWNIAVVPLGVNPIDDIPQAICLVILTNLLFGRFFESISK